MNRDSPSRPNIPRLTLGDLTNKLGKRGFSLISRAPASLSKLNNAQLAKGISLLGKKSEVKISGSKYPKIANVEQSLPLLKGGKTYRLFSRANSESVVDSNPLNRIQMSSAEENLGLLGSGVDNSCVNSQSVSKYDLEIDETSPDPVNDDDSEATQAEPFLETLGSQTASTDGIDSGFSSLLSTACPQFGGSRSTNMHWNKPFELERCMWQNGDPLASSDVVLGADSLKTCSCSFCMKAAYIWSELHYMDAKGRISTLAKSKKEASNLVRLYSSESGMSTGRGIFSHSSSELEVDLMNRTKSLFVSLEETFGNECSKLETEFSSLKDIRESFKMDLSSQMPPIPSALTTSKLIGKQSSPSQIS